MATTEEEKPAAPEVKKEETKSNDTSKDTPAIAAATEESKKDEAEKPAALSEEETIANLVERLRFFFSDANVRQDNFMRNLLMSPDKKVGIDNLLKFNTIKQYTTDPAMIKKAAATLPDVLTVVEGENAIIRVKDFTKDLMHKNIAVTLVVGNLPMEEQQQHDDNHKQRLRYAVTVEDLKKLFEGYGPIALIKLRYGYSKHSSDDINTGNSPGGRRPKGPRKPIGSALVEFETVEAFEKAAEETLTMKKEETVEPKRKLQVASSELTVVTLADYIEKSRKRKRDNKDPNGDDDKADAEDDGPKYTVDWKPGCVIKMEGLSDTCDREQILDAVAKGMDKSVDDIKEMKLYVDFSRGQKDGCIRFPEPDQVTAVFNKLQSGELEVAGAKVDTVTVLEGDVEKKYWDDFMAFKSKQLRQREEENKGRNKKKKFRRH